MLTRSDYHAFRRVYQPADLKLIVVAESPPVSGLYFYNPAGAVSEPLFSAFMQQIGVQPASKDEGLRSFHQKGWLLADATYEPVNVNAYKKVERNGIIMRDYPLLRDDLSQPDARPERADHSHQIERLRIAGSSAEFRRL